jgi:hypothetical protein
MTIARTTDARPTLRVPAARVELAWTASASALGAGAGYASAALRLEVEWDAADPAGRAAVRASVDRAGALREVALPAEAEVRVLRRGPWTHVEVMAAAPGRPLLSACFRAGRLAYCSSDAPRAAGLAGGTYDAPTGILELYDA